MTEKLCYNKGCGQNYKENENTNESCQHHPGIPVFHDAYKGWSCCSKKTTDFTEFLNIKGCSKGMHNPIKPNEPPKPNIEVEDVPVPQPRAPVSKISMERPSASTKMTRLPQTIGASLKPLIAKLNAAGDSKKEEKGKCGEVPYGTPCKNSACKGTYYGEGANEETCTYHNGLPVFHEGMKYWSCCQRKTSDFNAFLEQEGCNSGKHCWIKEEVKDSSVSCRFDWHQTGSLVVISVFAKASFPDKSFVNLNPVKCRIHIVFGEDRCIFDTELVLGGIVDVAASSVEYLGSKVEIKLKKAEPVTWKSLTYTVPSAADESNMADDLENVNLDDVQALVNQDALDDAKKRFFTEQKVGQ